MLSYTALIWLTSNQTLKDRTKGIIAYDEVMTWKAIRINGHLLWESTSDLRIPTKKAL